MPARTGFGVARTIAAGRALRNHPDEIICSFPASHVHVTRPAVLGPPAPQHVPQRDQFHQHRLDIAALGGGHALVVFFMFAKVFVMLQLVGFAPSPWAG